MIPANGWIATFGSEDGRVVARPVVAWGSDGQALIADRRGGLVVACRRPDFLRIDHDDVAAIIPGGGWHAEFTVDGQTWSEPVVAWRIGAAGDGEPLFTDDGGGISTTDGDEVRLFHPDATGRAGRGAVTSSLCAAGLCATPFRLPVPRQRARPRRVGVPRPLRRPFSRWMVRWS